jgi:phage tail tape-measure protein
MVSAQALVAFRGNHYSVAPEFARTVVTVICRLGASHLDLATAAGTVIARHALAPTGAGAMVRNHGHVLALEQAAMTAASPAAPHRRKQRIPPGPAALAAADALRAMTGKAAQPAAGDGVIDLARYAAAAQGRNTLTT